jgi:endogenous inhibitor of DNA gyrase (YacG/DUF329 family)
MGDARITRTSRGTSLDLRRCKRCGKMPRGKLRKAEMERHFPYCSYHCQEWARLEDAQEYINTLK